VSEQTPDVEARIPAELQGEVQHALARAGRERVLERVREGDASLWAAPGTPEVANRLGWLTIAERMLGDVAEIEAFAEEIRSDGFLDVVLLGMGGSSLAPEVLRRTFGHSDGHPRLHVLDSTDATRVRDVSEAVEPRRTLFVVSSKSGGTIEPLSLFAHFFSLIGEGANFIAITDPGSGLADLARERGFRHTFLGDPDIGGRYSALSPFGIVPAALMGVDVRGLLEGAASAWETSIDPRAAASAGGAESDQVAAVWLGTALGALARAGRDKLTFLISDSLPGLGLWLEQLVAESTGKHGTGILPVAEEPVGAVAEYGEDRVFAHVSDTTAPDTALAAHASALGETGHPVITIPTAGPGDLGRLFMLWELAVAVAGWGLQINPFDQPNVQQAKDATRRVLDGYEADHRLPSVRDASDAEVRSLVLGAGPPSYVAIMAYTEPTPAFDDAVGELRRAIRAATGATTTFGYGPRFLHSTGQFHKGGPRTGRFLQLLHDGPQDVVIPGAPYSFTTLKNAQAIGDLDTLRGLGLPAERVRLEGGDPASALRELAARVTEPEQDAGARRQASRPGAG
jgi:transaldolase/glucose-6-phosphate isomerase